MDLKQLRYLQAIAEEGSFSRAARVLGLSQPSLSQRMRELELELGGELFLRGSFGVRLTDLGTMVVGQGAAILRQVEQIRTEARSRTGDPVGEVALGLPTTVALHLTVPIVREVSRRFPGLRLRVVESMSGYLQEWLASGRIDLAVLYKVDGAPGLKISPILTEDLYLIAARLGHEEDRASIPMAELAALPLVLPSREHGLRQHIEAAVAQAGVALHVGVEIESLVHMKELVRDGDRFTILPFAAVREEIRDGSLIARRIVEPVLRRPIALAVSADRPLSQGARRVGEVVERAIQLALRGRGEVPPKARAAGDYPVGHSDRAT
ncbi:LysR family transcriptional regulator [Falsiroseomonas oryzae]|uniref:LysR family transcriptional regulator n=1 Tax=Falsiroseomonas oryzae TaxID=2766473 RepID=UPI0022EB89B9|nr:LysR substrate-binding domain-containing protein [Roseomonas sp. MO-31]